MEYKFISSPEQLLEYLDNHFCYGVIGANGKKFLDNNEEGFELACNNDWKLRSVSQMIKDGIGHCYDQVEIEREWFVSKGYEVKTFWVVAYQNGIENSGFSHTYLIYKDNNKWKLFEHSDFSNRGIHEFNSVKEAVKWQAAKQIKYAESVIKPIDKYDVIIKEFTKPNEGLTMKEYIEFVELFEDFKM